MWSLRSFSVRFLWSEVVWWGLPCGSWSCWSASSRCWGEDRTPPPRSAQRFRFPLPGRRSGRQAPPRRSSDEAEKIKKNTRHRIPSRNCCFLFLFSHHMLSTKAKTKKRCVGFLHLQHGRHGAPGVGVGVILLPAVQDCPVFIRPAHHEQEAL